MRKKNAFRYTVLLVCFLYMILIVGSCVYVEWNANAPKHVNVLFPEGTQIIRKTDSHKGFFRREGVAVLVAQIPEESIWEFGARLRNEGFIALPPVGRARDLLCTVEEVRHILDSPTAISYYEDDAVAFIEEAFSDCFAVIYDLETGLYCHVEYDE